MRIPEPETLYLRLKNMSSEVSASAAAELLIGPASSPRNPIRLMSSHAMALAPRRHRHTPRTSHCDVSVELAEAYARRRFEKPIPPALCRPTCAVSRRRPSRPAGVGRCSPLAALKAPLRRSVSCPRERRPFPARSLVERHMAPSGSRYRPLLPPRRCPKTRWRPAPSSLLSSAVTRAPFAESRVPIITR